MLKTVARKILPLWLRMFILEHRYMLKYLNKQKIKLEKLFDENKEDIKNFSIDNEKKWIKKLNKIVYSYHEFTNVGEAFATSKIEIIQNRELSPTDIIAICVQKDDLIKLKKFIEHHRKIGINKFIILDNDSTDGSLEWLLKQKDIIVLQTKISYTSVRRVAWINRIIAHYGDNRWYLVADSDELLVYDNCENKKIQEVIKHYEKLKIVRPMAVMLDMYAEPEYYKDGKEEDYYSKCIYFDKNTYKVEKKECMNLVTGGPRERLFNISPWLTKYPLFYFRKQDVYCKSHFMYPYVDNLKSGCELVLKHYKFLPSEFEKYKKIAKIGNYSNNSKQYKQYIKVWKKDKDLNFMCNSTAKYIDSTSLKKIDIYERIRWS